MRRRRTCAAFPDVDGDEEMVFVRMHIDFIAYKRGQLRRAPLNSKELCTDAARCIEQNRYCLLNARPMTFSDPAFVPRLALDSPASVVG